MAIIFKAKECWDEEHLPSTEQLILSTLDEIDSTKFSYTIYRRGEGVTNADARLAIVQLSEPNEANPMIVIGLTPPELPETAFHPPISLSQYVEPHDERNQQLLLTPRFTITDLHIDSGDGISSPLGRCKKLWLVFPPTAKNLTLLKCAEGQKAKLQRIGQKLEGGLVFTTNSEEAIYLPAGCIHAVITTKGGFLIAVDFTTPLSSKPTATILRAYLNDVGSPSFKKEIFQRFLSSIDHGLSNKQISLAISSWISAVDRVLEYGKENQGWKKQAVKVWDEFLNKKEAASLVCPCGSQRKGDFAQHLRRDHLWERKQFEKRKACELVVKEEVKDVHVDKRLTRASKKQRLL